MCVPKCIKSRNFSKISSRSHIGNYYIAAKGHNIFENYSSHNYTKNQNTLLMNAPN